MLPVFVFNFRGTSETAAFSSWHTRFPVFLFFFPCLVHVMSMTTTTFSLFCYMCNSLKLLILLYIAHTFYLPTYMALCSALHVFCYCFPHSRCTSRILFSKTRQKFHKPISFAENLVTQKVSIRHWLRPLLWTKCKLILGMEVRSANGNPWEHSRQSDCRSVGL